MTARLFILCIMLPLLVHGQVHTNKDILAKKAFQSSQQASELWQQGKIREAVGIFDSLAATPGIREAGNLYNTILYNLACGYSLLDEKEKSLAYLNEAIQAGYSDYDNILKDSDLKNIRSDAGFENIAQFLNMNNFKWESPAFSSKFHPDLSEDEKVAGLSKVWSETKNGFAYFDHVPTLDWDSLFVASVADVRKTTSVKEYYRVLQRMVAQLHDGHTRIDMPKELVQEAYAHPALQTRLVEDKVVIVKVLSDSLEKSGIQPGQEIISIDGMPVHEYAKFNVDPYQSSSTGQWLKTSTYEYALLCGAKGNPVELELLTKEGKSFKRQLPRNTFGFPFYQKNIDSRFLEGNIAYVALNTFGDRNVVYKFDSLFSSLQKSRAMILDLRENTGGNTDNAYQILSYFVDQPFKIVQGKSRNYNAFDRAMRKGQHWGENPSIEMAPHSPDFYSKPVVVLMSSKTGSSAEEFCVVIKSLHRATMIGTASAGSTGQPLFYSLPGGGRGVVCTTRTYTPEGKEFVGKGLEPDIEALPRLSDVQTGNDPALRAALSFLKNVQSGK